MSQLSWVPNRRLAVIIASVIAATTVGLVSTPGVAAAPLATGVFAPARQATTEAESAARMSITPAELELTDAPATVEIVITDAPPTHGFQFELLYDPEVVAIVNVTLGPFIASTGRAFQPLGPNLDTPGRTVVGAITAGAEPEAASGEGILARIDIAPLTAGDSALEIVSASIVTADLRNQPVEVTNGKVAVIPGVDPKAATEFSGRAATLAAAPPSDLAEDYVAAVAAEAALSTAEGGGADDADQGTGDGEIGDALVGTMDPAGDGGGSGETRRDTSGSGSQTWWVVALTVVLLAGGLWVIGKRT